MKKVPLFILLILFIAYALLILPEKVEAIHIISAIAGISYFLSLIVKEVKARKDKR